MDLLERLKETRDNLNAVIEQFESERGDPENLTPWLDIGSRLIGKDEIDDNAEIVEFLAAGNVSIDPDGTSWCGAYVSACLYQAGYPDGSLRARDYAEYGVECECKVGAIAVFKSHVAFVIEVDPEVKILGGNQSNECNISPLKWYKNLIGYRWPV